MVPQSRSSDDPKPKSTVDTTETRSILDRLQWMLSTIGAKLACMPQRQLPNVCIVFEFLYSRSLVYGSDLKSLSL